MTRLAIVVQRYGEEINGGAELLARLLAEQLIKHHAVEVLTSCALDYTRWEMTYPEGASVINGVSVLRFAHPQRQDIGRARVPLRHKLRFKTRGVLRRLGVPLVLQPRGKALFDGAEFLRHQGPHCPGLLEHLEASRFRYDVVIFCTALYEPSAQGLLRWGQRSILVPFLHDEKAMYLPIFGSVFRDAGALLFSTESERRLAARLYGIDTGAARIAGVGMDVRAPTDHERASALARHGLQPGYLVYVGRIDVAKGCQEMLDAFGRLSRRQPDARLVLVGRAVMTIPDDPRIISTGFISEVERNALIADAAALIIPSRYESLSLVLLEAMALGTPVLANAQCDVLADHISSSGAGIAYRGERQLRAAMQQMLELPADVRARLGAQGAAYVQQRYTWERVLGVVDQAIAEVRALPAPEPGSNSAPMASSAGA